jgi:predicted lysophospholipase L1 biosynthesis ABC-type transport system permease subunit
VRQEEIAIRAALGASRWRVLSQLLTESILLSLLGGAGGAILSIFSVRLLRNTLPADVQWFCDVNSLKLNGTAFAFTLLLAIVSACCPDWLRHGSIRRLIRPERLQPNLIASPGAATISGVPRSAAQRRRVYRVPTPTRQGCVP